MSLKVDIKKSFGDFNLDVAFEAGNETLALLGASGCGKTMTLKMIAGIEKPDSGVIELDGVTLFDSEKRINLSPQKRHVGMMFQNYALFENMTVFKNISMGIRSGRNNKAAQEEIEAVMDCLHISDLAERHPSQLSGGQQQRVALARIMVSHPGILMLDEPFSALDQHLRFKTESFVKEALRSFNKTVLWVSHNRDEVYRRADRVAIMDRGHVDAIGPVREVFENPKTVNGAVLTGCKNILPAVRINDHHVRFSDHDIVMSTEAFVPTDLTHVGIRMHHIRPVSDTFDGDNIIRCIVTGETANPFSYVVNLAAEHEPDRLLVMMEIDKDKWESMRSRRFSVCIDPSSILLLR